MNILTRYYRKYRSTVIAVLIVLVVAAVGSLAFFSGIFPGKSVYARTARLELEVEGQKRAFEGEVFEDMTVLEALQASAAAGDISLSYTMKNNKLVVERINGYHDPVKSISFFVNSTPVAAEDIYALLVKPGDIITVKIQ